MGRVSNVLRQVIAIVQDILQALHLYSALTHLLIRDLCKTEPFHGHKKLRPILNCGK